MSCLRNILDGLEAALELERELGVRSVPLDRSLLAAPAAPARRGTSAPSAAAAAPGVAARGVSPVPAPAPSAAPATAPYRAEASAGFVFLHHAPLSPEGAVMIEKAVAALGAPQSAAKVFFDGALPDAKVHIVLGRDALRKWFPGVSASPGQWISAAGAGSVLVTYSPAHILRFGESPSVRKMKLELWNALKSVPARVAASRT